MGLLILLLIVIGSGAALFVYPRWRRRHLLAQPFPADWLALMDARLPRLRRLQPQERRQLLDRMRLFLAGKQFHGCAGLQVTEAMRVIVAAQACLLLLNREGEVYPRLRHVLLYPAMFTRAGEEWNEDGTVSEVHKELLGESWQDGKVILSWEDIEYDLENPDDGENVVLHEFAHQLDGADGSENGSPPLQHNDPQRWHAVMSQEFAALERAVADGEETFLDAYAASAPAEFFAVLTETFFELPEDLKHAHPALYRELRQYYQVNPARWQG
ncbi:MAG TPA: M90 family metallopeptidase [Hyphomicrobiales bacterium]|nr:M90 family metallopeptidase [Hyphomicrobiales bacterium]